MKRILRALAVAGIFAPFATVQAVSFKYNAGVIHETDAFASFSTTGALMAGTAVHVEYTDGSFYDTTWTAFASPGYGGVNNANLFLQAGNTGTTGYTWMLSNPTASTRQIRAVSLDGQPGNTVFDTTGSFGKFVTFSFVGTPGTSTGLDFDLHEIYRNLYDGITITYSDAVALTGAAPVGDIYRRMMIEFAPDIPLFPNRAIQFRQDTDSLAFGSVLVPASVPEGGATVALLCAGLAGLAVAERRRARSTS